MNSFRFMSKYRQIYESLHEKLHLIAVDGKLPSEQNLSKMFKTSRPTLRKALSMLALEGKIETRCGEGSFICTENDESISAEFRKNYLLVAKTDIVESFNMRQIRGIQTTCDMNDIFMQLVYIKKEMPVADKMNRIIDAANSSKVLGLILLDYFTPSEVKQIENNIMAPLLTIGYKVSDGISSFVFDYYKIAYAAADFLHHQRGCQQFIMAIFNKREENNLREKALGDYSSRNSMQSRILYSHWDSETVCVALKAMLKSMPKNKKTGIIFHSDGIAYNVMKLMASSGIDPQTYSIMGFGNYMEYHSRKNCLDTFDVNPEVQVAGAVYKFLSSIKSGDNNIFHQVSDDFEIKERSFYAKENKGFKQDKIQREHLIAN